MNSIKNWKKILSNAIIVLLILYIIITLFVPKLSMTIFGFRSFIVVSSSMEPDIHVNDMIFVRRPKEDNLEERDVITFLVYIPEVQEESYVTHYIGEITTDEFGTTIYKTQGATKAPGDYDDWTDSEGNPVDITFDDIEGEYLFRIPYIGYVVTMLQDPIFVALLLVNGTIIYFLVKTIKQSFHKDDKQKKELEE